MALPAGAMATVALVALDVVNTWLVALPSAAMAVNVVNTWLIAEKDDMIVGGLYVGWIDGSMRRWRLLDCLANALGELTFVFQNPTMSINTSIILSTVALPCWFLTRFGRGQIKVD